MIQDWRHRSVRVEGDTQVSILKDIHTKRPGAQVPSAKYAPALDEACLQPLVVLEIVREMANI